MPRPLNAVQRSTAVLRASATVARLFPGAMSPVQSPSSYALLCNTSLSSLHSEQRSETRKCVHAGDLPTQDRRRRRTRRHRPPRAQPRPQVYHA